MTADRQVARPHALLQPDGRRARRSGRGLLPDRGLVEDARRRQDDRRPARRSTTPGGDHHDIWIDPGNGNRIAVSHDGGVSISDEPREDVAAQVQLPIAQMYHVTVDDRIPYWVYGNRQDGPSSRGPSNSKLGVQDDQPNITRGMWTSVAGGESGWATPDPREPRHRLVERFRLRQRRRDRHALRRARTNTARAVEIWPRATIGWPAADLKYRFVWTFPLTISPHDHNRIYVGSQHVHQTTDGGATWQVISPDLTRERQDRGSRARAASRPTTSASSTRASVFAIAESRAEARA